MGLQADHALDRGRRQRRLVAAAGEADQDDHVGGQDDDQAQPLQRRRSPLEPLGPSDLATQKNVHVVLSSPGAVRGNHHHERGTEIMTVYGPAHVRLRDGEADDVIDLSKFVMPAPARKDGPQATSSERVAAAARLTCPLHEAIEAAHRADAVIFADFGYFEILDYVTANLMMPFGGILLAVFVGWRMSQAKAAKTLNEYLDAAMAFMN